jgi:radical SAM superfamily enzyme YgiQ (UPF0313 family)
MSDIVLTTLNARYTHASMGLRSLRANLGDLQEASIIHEFVTGQATNEVVEQLLNHAPKIIGFGVYIWNVEETTKIVALLKRVAPEVVIVLGGPEVSFEIDEQRICQLADYVITGWGEVTLRKVALAVLRGPKPLMKVHAGEQPPLAELAMPYREYTDEDIAHRTLYVEASRGCPFKCEFCLSALDKTAWPFETELFLAEMALLYERGARQFKFVDRTFNLNVKVSLKILQFFLDRYTAEDPVYAHFELVPDHLPDSLKETIALFPAGALQFEIGIQTFNTEVQALVSRKQNNDKAADNLRWLHTQSRAHMHVDLIAGLPGESLQSFGAGFDRLVGLGPHEIQFGILKRLRGTPIIRHTAPYRMVFSPDAPYEIVANQDLSFSDMQRMSRFARYWDLVANSGRFTQTLPLLLQDQPFAHFMAFADWLYGTTGKTHQIALEKLFDFLHDYLTTQTPCGAQAKDAVQAALLADYEATGARGKLGFMKRGLAIDSAPRVVKKSSSAAPARQQRHVVSFG